MNGAIQMAEPKECHMYCVLLALSLLGADDPARADRPSQPARSDDSNILRFYVFVPSPDAELWIEDTPTRQRGMEREFVSPPAEPGKSYRYTFRATWTENGREIRREKQVRVRVGEPATVRFDRGLEVDSQRPIRAVAPGNDARNERGAQRPIQAAAEDRIADADRQFVEKASAAGMAEVKLGQIAAERAANSGVKDFARHMVDDHSKANKELEAIVSKKRLNASRELSAEHQRLADRLPTLQGETFSRAYIDQMVKDHEEAVKLFQQEAEKGRDAELRQFAERALPTLREHLKMAQQLAKQNSANGATKNSS